MLPILLVFVLLVPALLLLPFVLIAHLTSKLDEENENNTPPSHKATTSTQTTRAPQPTRWIDPGGLESYLAEKERRRNTKGYFAGNELYLPCFQKYDLSSNSLMKRRMKDACSSDTKPLAVDRLNKKATFPRSNGDVYHTDLDWCDCRAFDDSCEPCKHILRLSIEIGVINAPLSTDPPKPPASPRRSRADIFNPLVAEIEKHPESIPTLQKVFFDYADHNYCEVYDYNSVLYCIDAHNLVVKKKAPRSLSSSDVRRELLARQFPFPDNDINNQFTFMRENRQLTADFLDYITYELLNSKQRYKVYYAPLCAVVSPSGDFKICCDDLLEYLTCRVRSIYPPENYRDIYLGNNTISSSLPSYVIDALRIYDPLLHVEKT